MREQIYGTNSHPDREALKSYSGEVPEGTRRVRFDDRSWGRSANLFCYFTDLDTNRRYRLSVFSRGDYKPYENGPAFNLEPLGGTYEIVTAPSKNGLPKFIAARSIN
jgi:hypothetical protein